MDYAAALTQALSQIRAQAGIDDPNDPEALSASQIANRLLAVVSQFTNWENPKEVQKAKKAQMNICKLAGNMRCMPGPNTQVPEEPDGPRGLQTKIGLLRFAYNQLLKWYGMGVGESVMPSLQAIELLAISDPSTFASIVESFGLKVDGVRSDSALDTTVTEAEIAAVATVITEFAETNGFVALTEDQKIIKKLGESFGYIIRLAA